MFKLIQLLAAFVVRQYEKEAKRLHKLAGKADAEFADLTVDLHALAGQMEQELAVFLQEQEAKRAIRVSEVEQARQVLEQHSAAANAASEKARAVKGALV